MRKLTTALSIVLAVAVTAAFAVAAFALYFIPKRDEKLREDLRREAAEKAELIKSKLSELRAKRDAEVAQSVAVVEQKAEEQKAQDSVDVANEWLKG